MPLGVWAAANSRVHRVIQVIIDTLQTLPAFVYLIPVVMLFRVGDFSAMIAVVLYALAPAVRYTAHGIRSDTDTGFCYGIKFKCHTSRRFCGF